ncbi:hypothetical protein EG68_04071 [Paragonimus skrjabini miyazakii]|uniref:GPI inositol-deacylase n=1 Tax=Paragonimus skrjabini miyazakii TaxID=59628 RepID=A0A8S9YZV9_9TREM|nr:hypothetical protein EG68_04071 [Paragonimus skrjabini miyazakii]
MTRFCGWLTLKVFLFTAVVSFLLLTVIEFVWNVEENRCIMSYMTMQPILKSLPMAPSPKLSLASYRLQQYCSGYCRPVSQKNGFPVLFLPGTRGSSKMVRSIASAQEYFEFGTDMPFDFFSIDYNEDTTALSGELVQCQSEFLRIAVDHILAQYSGTVNAPRSVLVVGHSLGALVAFYLLSDSTFDQHKITTVISLAAPVFSSIFSPGYHMDHVYDRISNYLARVAAQPSHPLVVISLTGGSRDLMVPDILGNVNQNSDGLKALWLSTSAVAHVWASCDHLCIVWCRQLVYELVSSLHELTLLSPNMNNMDARSRLRVFRNHLLTRPLQLDRLILHDPVENRSTIEISQFPRLEWMYKTRQDRVVIERILPTSGLFMKFGPFFEQPEQRVLIMVHQSFNDFSLTPVPRTPWLFLCIPDLSTSSNMDDQSPCARLVPIDENSPYTTWMPAHRSHGPYGVAMLTVPQIVNVNTSAFHSGHPFPGAYVVVAIPPPMFPETKLSLLLETIDALAYRLHTFTDTQIGVWPLQSATHVPLYVSNTPSVDVRYFGTTNRTQSIFHRFYFPNDRFIFSQSLPSPRLSVVVNNCAKPTNVNALVSWFTPWNHHFYNSFILPDRINLIDLDVPGPSKGALSNESAFVDLFLNPLCSYTLTIEYSILGWATKLLRLHWSHLFGLIMAHLLIELILVTCLPCMALQAIRSLIAPPKRISLNNEDVQPAYRLSPDCDSCAPSHVWHLGAFLVHFASFHLFNNPFSDWTHMQKYGHLGLRFRDLTSLGSHVSLAERVLAHGALLPLSLPISVLVPCLVDLSCPLMRGVMKFCNNFLRRFFYPQYRLPTIQTRNTLLTTCIILLIGGLVSEALCIFLLAARLLFKINISLLMTTSKPHHMASTPDETISPVRSYSVDQFAFRSLPEGKHFRLNLLVAFMLVFLSILLTESWFSLYIRFREYIHSGYYAIHLFFRLPVNPSDVTLFTICVLLVTTSWDSGLCLRCLSTDKPQQKRTEQNCWWYSFVGLAFTLTLFLCVFFLLQTAVRAVRVFFLGSLGLVFLDLSVILFKAGSCTQVTSTKLKCV